MGTPLSDDQKSTIYSHYQEMDKITQKLPNTREDVKIAIDKLQVQIDIIEGIFDPVNQCDTDSSMIIVSSIGVGIGKSDREINILNKKHKGIHVVCFDSDDLKGVHNMIKANYGRNIIIVSEESTLKAERLEDLKSIPIIPRLDMVDCPKSYMKEKRTNHERQPSRFGRNKRRK